MEFKLLKVLVHFQCILYRYLTVALMYAKRQLRSLFIDQRNRQKLMFRAANRSFSPGSRIRQGDVLVECPIGMIADDSKEFCGMFVSGIL